MPLTPSFFKRYWLVLLVVGLITLAHYNTAFHIHALHGIYRRLYYFPIILAAFRDGTRGGVVIALLVCGVYLPHAMGVIGFDPGTPVEKSLEMVLYLAVGLLSGILVSRINAARRRLEATAADLRHTLEEKNAMEAELVRSARLAAVGRLSAGLAHEIRNPLASIKGSAEVLADDYPENTPKARLMAILLEETGRLNQVLTRFLAFARTEPGELGAVDLAVEARAVAELAAHQPGQQTITVDAPESLPAARGNGEQVRQVILNLVLNALAVTPEDGRVKVQLSADDTECTVSVTDQGPGFSSEALANFGTPFYSTREGGTGLGLATSLRIVEDLGGSLMVDETCSTGARVILRLPRLEP
jgi:signal transduction histidine kinase